MKRAYLSLTLLSILAFSCNKDKIADLERRNQALMMDTQVQDSLLNTFMASFDEFEANLENIKQKESLISMETDGSEFRKEGKEKILDDMMAIDELLVRNQELIQELNERVEKADGRTAYFKTTINRFKKQLTEKNTEITGLKENLVALNIQVEDLNQNVRTLEENNSQLSEIKQAQLTRLSDQKSEMSQQDSIMLAQRTELRKGYVLKGTAKELKSQNILTKVGGFLGIGATKQLSPDFDASLFEIIDIQQTNQIPVDTKRAELLTSHPADSYVFNDDGKMLESLEITDPERFWKHSKYLVVVLN
ncbi:MAG: hypothetical protein AAF587_41450 [Bacteroidota bacterium]